ncbi:Heterokaryon incompatibility protein (HET) domain containing protein [Naviculisporaceae sp. PSN 640]
MENFQHEPLQAGFIRLLKLLPGLPGTPLQCELRPAKLTSDLYYEAVSYCWGEQTNNQLISINNAPFSITSNLHLALSHFRHTLTPRLLWVDAICINQQDLDEKNDQIPLMREIYQTAKCVLVWLGDADEDTELAMTLIRDAASALTRMRILKPGDFKKLKEIDSYTAFQQYGLPPLEQHPGYKSFVELIGRPWFYRVWIIQEVSVASKVEVWCGNVQVPWDELVDAVEIITKRNPGISGVILYDHAVLLLMLRVTRETTVVNEPASLLQLLVRHRRSLATVPHDKVYALCGLAGDREILGIVPDYRTTKEEVFMQTALRIMEQSGNLDVLSHAGLGNGGADSWPSWTPDWTSQKVEERSFIGHLLDDFLTTTIKTFDAAGGTAFVQRNVDPSLVASRPRVGMNGLLLRGMVVDVVAEVGKPSHPFASVDEEEPARFRDRMAEFGQLFLDISDVWAHWVEIVNRTGHDRYPQTGEEKDMAFFHTITMGTILTQSFGPEEQGATIAKVRRYIARLLKWNKIFRRLHFPKRFTKYLWYGVGVSIVLRLGFSDEDEEGHEEETLFELMDVFLLQNVFGAGKRLFRTENGLIGLAPDEIVVGDTLSICDGARMPLLLRDRGGGLWQLVGPCYVHGIMHGEARDASAVGDIVVV